MSFFKEYDAAVDSFLLDQDRGKLVLSLTDLRDRINNSRDDAEFASSHTTLKEAINKIIGE